MKKVLVISYYWPPSGGIGVLRSLKFVKYLRLFGWEPVVVVPSNADYPYLDESNLKDIPESIEVIRIPIKEPFKIFKFLTGRKNVSLNNIVHVRDKKSFLDEFGIWVRGNFFIPDARCLWIKPAVSYLEIYLKTNKIDAVFSDGPPHTNTVIATRIAKSMKIPYLADFQDPWTQVDYYKLFKIGKRADQIHKKLEQETFSVANKITIASPSWKLELEKIGARNVDVLYYGFDEDDFKHIVPTPDDKFTLCHSGLLGYDRNPENLFEALHNLIKTSDEFRLNFSLKILGQMDIKVLNSIKKYNLDDYVNNMGLVNRNLSLKEISNAWLLILPLNKAENAKGRLPGKIYEYIRVGRPIMSFGPEESDVHDIIKEYNLGKNFTWNDVKSVEVFLVEQFQNFKLKKFNPQVTLKDISFFSNYQQTKNLAGYLDEITSEMN